MRLAMALGWSLHDVQTYMTCAEVRQWRAYDVIEPFGEERADLRAAIVAHTVASCFAGRPQNIEDFMPDFEQETRRQTVEEMQARVRLALQTVERKNDGEPDGSCRIADR